MDMEILLFLIEDAVTGCKSTVKFNRWKHAVLKWNTIILKIDTWLTWLSVDQYVQEMFNCALA